MRSAPDGAPPMTSVAERFDSSGFREKALFIGPSSARIFSFQHLPRNPFGGLVICSSINTEFLANYRREVILGRRLAGAGVAVMRFHYRGTGHSDANGLTFDGMVEDARRAHQELESTLETRSLAFLGTRWGALIAASLASSFPQAPLALWQPVPDAESFFKDAIRARLIRLLKQGTTGSSPEDELRRLRETGYLDVVGYRLENELYESSSGCTVLNELGPEARRVFLLELTRRPSLSRPFQDMASALQKTGCSVDSLVVKEQPNMWFTGPPRSGTAADIVEPTARWLQERLREQ